MVILGVLALFILGLITCLYVLIRVMQDHQRQTTELLSNAVNQTVSAVSEAMNAAPFAGGKPAAEQAEDTEQADLLRAPWEMWGEVDPALEGGDHTDTLLPDEPAYDNADRVALVQPGYSFRPPPDLTGEDFPEGA